MSTLSCIDWWVRPLKEKYGLVNFIETGTFEGDGLKYALTLNFERYFSCDIVPGYAFAARRRWRDRKDVVIYHGDSLSFIDSLPRDIGPCFWWLDAHQPKFYDPDLTETIETKFPVLLELERIKCRPSYRDDVVIVDDLIAIQNSPRWHPGEVSDYFQIKHFTFEDLVATLSDTHDTKVDLGMEGLLTFMPKIDKVAA